MKDIQLLSVLRNIELADCAYLGNNLFYIKKIVRTRYYDCYSERDKYSRSEEEFLIIARNDVKQGIIHNCNNIDLHWYVLTHWRNKSVLSNALRTGIIRQVWPQINSVTCCYNWDDNKAEKYQKTKRLADLAGLAVIEGNSCWMYTR